MRETVKDLRQQIESLKKELWTLELEFLKKEILKPIYEKDPVKKYLNRKQAIKFDRNVLIRGTVSHYALLDPQHLVVVALIKTYNPDEFKGTKFYKSFSLTKFHMEVGRYYMPWQNLNSATNDKSRIAVLFTFSDDYSEEKHDYSKSYSLHADELCKLISVDDPIISERTSMATFIKREEKLKITVACYIGK